MIETIDKTIVDVARAVAKAGGRAVLVGGYVRDRLLGRDSKDYDVEIYGLAPDAVSDLLSGFGELVEVGRAFGVLRVKGIDADFSLPRRDSKRGPGHRGFDVAFDPDLDFAEAARRRDLTVNSIGLDPLSGLQLRPDPAPGLVRPAVVFTRPHRYPPEETPFHTLVRVEARQSVGVAREDLPVHVAGAVENECRVGAEVVQRAGDRGLAEEGASAQHVIRAAPAAEGAVDKDRPGRSRVLTRHVACVHSETFRSSVRHRP